MSAAVSVRHVRVGVHHWTKIIRVRGLSARCTEVVEDFTNLWESDKEHLTIGRTFIEAPGEVLLSIADQLRTDEPFVDFYGENMALYEQAVKNADAARIRWATKIEKAVDRVAPAV